MSAAARHCIAARLHPDRGAQIAAIMTAPPFLGFQPTASTCRTPSRDTRLLDPPLGSVLEERTRPSFWRSPGASARSVTRSGTLMERVAELKDPLWCRPASCDTMPSAMNTGTERDRRRREPRASGQGDAPQDESVAEAVQILHGAGVTAKKCSGSSHPGICPTLTAHPTEPPALGARQAPVNRPHARRAQPAPRVRRTSIVRSTRARLLKATSPASSPSCGRPMSCARRRLRSRTKLRIPCTFSTARSSTWWRGCTRTCEAPFARPTPNTRSSSAPSCNTVRVGGDRDGNPNGFGVTGKRCAGKIACARPLYRDVHAFRRELIKAPAGRRGEALTQSLERDGPYYLTAAASALQAQPML